MKPRLTNPVVVVVFVLLVIHSWANAQTESNDSLRYYYDKVIQPNHSDDLLKAYVFFENQRAEAQIRQDTAAMIYNLQLISIIEIDLGLLYESEETAVAIINLLDAQPAHPNLQEEYRRAYNQLGRIYRQLKHSDQSIHYYQKSLSYTQQRIDSIILLNNMGNLYRDQNKEDLAQAYYTEAYAKSLNPLETLQYARILHNRFYNKAMEGTPGTIDSLLKAKKLREQFNDQRGLYSSFRGLAMVAHAGGNKEQALNYAENAFQLALQINSLTFLKDAYALKIELGVNPDFQNYKAITDSLDNLRLKEQNAYASLKYNVAKEREQTLAFKLQQERERTQKQRYQAIIIIVLIIGLFLFYILRLRYKKAKELEIYNTETRISKKVHDEVANDVYRVMTKLQEPKSFSSDVLDDLEEIYTKTRDISRENSFIDLDENFAETLNELLLAYNNQNCNVITRNSQTIRWEVINNNKKRAVYRILQELLTNMKKHSGATLVIINFKQNEKKITVEYRDNGAGSTLHKKNGLQNVENRIFVLNGTITFETEPGKGFKTRFTL
ncbi:tetratricopeptide repeat protein [uncultured Planktosalinus sp.]|uniref:tetratricopeptide repeat-containing sensor histidine kinase n=1 Tax=uncultured Planktosalinus sp. TaxID=1810935 RepID=UPI0030D96ACB